MEATKALAERVNVRCGAVELSAWAWAARLREAAEECGWVEAASLADVVEAALVLDGADGLVDLAMAGSVCGGLGRHDVAALARLVDERLAGHALAA